MTKIESEFYNAMENIYYSAKKECGYEPKVFLDMLEQHGGIKTAHILLRGNGPNRGFINLGKRGCLHLTVECLVLKPEFRELFGKHELDTAGKRLRELGYDPNKCAGSVHGN